MPKFVNRCSFIYRQADSFKFGISCDRNKIQIGKWSEILVLKVGALKKIFTKHVMRIWPIAAAFFLVKELTKLFIVGFIPDL